MTQPNTYDLVILGGGSGGYACALRAAEFGKRVALIEKDKVGGTCLHRGCIPTKALLHAAEVADSSRESAKFGVRTAFEGIEMPAVLSYQQGVVERLWKGLQGTLAGRKVDMIYGDGRLASPTSVTVASPRRTRSRWAMRSTPATTWYSRPGRCRGRCPGSRWTGSG